MTTFASLGVSPKLCRHLAERGIDEPFPIQAATVADALAGRDVSGRAPTGSGKTIAFGLAIASRITSPARPRQPRALVLVPTRELASQVADEIRLLAAPKVGVVTVFGGAGYDPQRRALAKGAAIVVACPGRLEDLISGGAVHLGDVELVVVDEADRMADMGFMPAVRRILDQTRPKRQTLLFSATLDGDVDELVRRYQRSPVRHEVAGDERDGAEVAHEFREIDRLDRVAATADLVNEHGRTIVFCRTRHGADRLTRQLRQHGIEGAAIHGSRSQGQRERALAAFSTGRSQVLIATDVAARGIHVDDVACVVHFDLPADAKDYVHRSGRTGRAGASGVVVAFVLPEQRKDVAALRKAASTVATTAAAARPVAPAADRTGPMAATALAAATRGALHRQGTEPNRTPARATGQRGTTSRTTRRRKGRATMPIGTVKFFNSEKGYGFISREDGEDVFVHFSNIQGSGYRNLSEGQRVEFEIGQGRKGAEALDVRAI